MFSLTDLCLNRITEDPARCLRSNDETHPALLRPASDTFLRCEAQSIPRDRWAAVEQSTSAARRRPRPEARPQLLATLAARGALVDGVLPPKFFEGLRVDTLSLAACRARAPFLMLAQAQAKAALGHSSQSSAEATIPHSFEQNYSRRHRRHTAFV